MCQLGAVVTSQGLTGGGAAAKLTHRIAGRKHELLDRGLQFPTGCWLEAILRSLPCGPLQHGSLLHQSEQSRQKSVQEGRSQSFLA